MTRYICLGIAFVFSSVLEAQSNQKILQQKKMTKEEIAVNTTAKRNKLSKDKAREAQIGNSRDTILLSQKTSDYDSLGYMLQETSYQYSAREGRLIKEEKNTFDPNTSVLNQLVIEYPNKKDPVRRRLETKYLVYDTDITKNKYIWRKLYDTIGEITKEDTLTYNAEQELIEKSTYDYRGNTSLFRDYYKFNKKNQKKRWRMYSVWTTIDGRGEVAERKAKRRDYRYCYNNKGLLKKTWGKYYSTRFVQKIQYDKEGRLLEDKTTSKRKLKKQKVLDSGKKKLVAYLQKEIFLVRYEKGLKVLETKIIADKEFSKIEWEYQDSLMTTQRKYLRSKIVEEITWTYKDDQKLKQKKIQKYSTNGKPRSYTIVSYDESENPVREELYLQNKIYTTQNRIFDEDGNLVEETLSTANNPNIEKTTYTYKYY